jgi:hypothetical protein
MTGGLLALLLTFGAGALGRSRESLFEQQAAQSAQVVEKAAAGLKVGIQFFQLVVDELKRLELAVAVG